MLARIRLKPDLQSGFTAHANGVLAALATKLGKSKAQVMEAAMNDLEEKLFWTSVKGAFERTAANPIDASRIGSPLGSRLRARFSG
jgi:hypothetical protein